MKKCLQIILLFCFLAVAAQTKPDNTFVQENFTKKEVYIPMRDGVKLFTSIYIPKDLSKTKNIRSSCSVPATALRRTAKMNTVLP